MNATDEEDEAEDSEDCPRCHGSGGGPEHWACPDCGGSGRNLDLARQRREDYEADRWDAELDKYRASIQATTGIWEE